jgi:hypothetical protein
LPKLQKTNYRQFLDVYKKGVTKINPPTVAHLHDGAYAHALMIKQLAETLRHCVTVTIFEHELRPCNLTIIKLA